MYFNKEQNNTIYVENTNAQIWIWYLARFFTNITLVPCLNKPEIFVAILKQGFCKKFQALQKSTLDLLWKINENAGV